LCYLSFYLFSILLFFFFQAEDGIRDFHVTGVQTCALPIFPVGRFPRAETARCFPDGCASSDPRGTVPARCTTLARYCRRRAAGRSEERRVGKEWRWRWGREQ